MTDKDFLTHDKLQINRLWKYYWKDRLLWISNKDEIRKLQREKSEAKKRIHKYIRRSSKQDLKRLSFAL